MKRITSLIAVIAAFNLAASSYAQGNIKSNCPLPTVPSSPPDYLWNILRETLSAQLNSCLDNSDYFALYGASLLYSGDTAKAIEMLERSLLINPNNGSARIDYAQALFQSGQLLPAIEVNAALLREEEVPSVIRKALTKRQEEWEKLQHLWKHQLSYLYGHSSNLNNATYIKDYELTFQDGVLLLPLSTKSRAQSGIFNYLRATSQYYTVTDNGVSLFTLSARGRDSSISTSDTDELKISFEQESESAYSRKNWSLSAEHVRLGNEGLFSSVEASLKIHPNNTAQYLNLESRYVYFNENSALNEAYFAITPGIATTYNNTRLGVDLTIGMNKSLDGRSGDDRLVYGASLFYDFPFYGGRINTNFNYNKTKDSEGYSMLLSNNIARTTESWTTAIQYLYPINQKLTLHSSYYHRNQDSNIDLFKTKTDNFDVGFTFIY